MDETVATGTDDRGRKAAPCPVCRRPAASLFLRKAGSTRATYARCPDCGLVFQVAIPPAGDLAAIYDAGYFTLRGSRGGDALQEVWAFRLRTAERHLERIGRLVPPGAILDVGCGEGALLAAAAAAGWPERVGIDVSAEAVRAASRFGTVWQGTLRAQQLPPGAFDVVTFCDSLEHSPDPEADLCEAARLLRPGGWVYVVTPDTRGLTARLLRARWFQLKPNEHLRLFSAAALRRVLDRAGFVPGQAEAATKVLTPAFALTILGTTNPSLARAIGFLLPRSLARKPRELRSGDLVIAARRRGGPTARPPVSDYYQHSRSRILRRSLARLSSATRRRAFRRLIADLRPAATDRVLDVGVTADVGMQESNLFEQFYPHPDRLLALGIDPLGDARHHFPRVRFVQGDARALPFSGRSVDLVVSNATIEHVGTREQQAAFVREALRVGRKVVIVTPNRWFPLELHTFLPLLHYLPRRWHRRILRAVGFTFYAQERHLRLLGSADLRALFPASAGVVVRYGALGATIIATAVPGR